jgi:hypothetical protein
MQHNHVYHVRNSCPGENAPESGKMDESFDQSEEVRRAAMHTEPHSYAPQPNFLKRMFGLEAQPETKSSWFAPLTHNLTIDFDSKGKQFMETVETVNERLKSLEDVSKRMQDTVNKAAPTMHDPCSISRVIPIDPGIQTLGYINHSMSMRILVGQMTGI